ncbi:hypothetical protein HMPREF1983_01257 [Gemella bergeri ATCC 700627]|uniref:LiaF transmembrane domain-containing protein n=1 Tax=Gemella bergeri ATCC 700627 TaxID=1321820 RepID=U2RTJ3_9BACL|nr:LiaF domain-containing protein [Gemella bergeri]ERK56878.1 hypothetical protein HMPREF1983_01257 [Gemella bergeri ATCC 700627]
MRKKSLIGLLFIIFAISIAFGELNFFPSGIIFLTLGTIILGYFIVRGLADLDIFGTILPIALLVIIYNKHFHFAAISSAKIIWIAILLSIGISILFPKKLKYSFRRKKDRFRGYTKKTETQDYSNITFGENVRYININELDYFRSTTTFGSTNIYFEKLDTYSIKDVHISITATFGDVKIFIPKEWSVENRISSIFGEVNTPFSSPNADNVKVILTGNVTFGEVSIIYI